MPVPVSPAIPVVHRVALRTAGGAMLAAGGAAAVALALTGAGLLGTAVGASAVAVAVGATVYVSVQRRIAARIDLARQTLREARKRRFDGLARLAGAEERDELDALIRQVYRAGRTLQQEVERLQAAESFRREFLGDVSHELRTPIFAVSGFAETLLDGALEDEAVRRRFVEKILSAARRLEALSRDLGEIAQLESGRLQLAREPVDVRAVADEVADALERRAAEAGIALAVRIPPGLPPVSADRDRLRQVLSNLAENAVKYNDRGGSVELTARRLASGDVRIAVVDDGIGIPADALPRLTERFFRVDKSRSREAGGTGLGLSIVKHILEAHGQPLAVESRPGYGSAFAFTLPAADGLATPREDTPSPRRPARRRRPVGRGEAEGL